MACVDLDALVTRAIDQLTVLRVQAQYRCSMPPEVRCSSCPELTKEMRAALHRLRSVVVEMEEAIAVIGKRCDKLA